MRAHTQVRPYPLFVPSLGRGIYMCALGEVYPMIHSSR